MAVRFPIRSLQPASVTSLADVAASRSLPHPNATGTTGPDNHRVSGAVGDRHGALVDVGADFFTAAELADLKLPGLPSLRQHISRQATREGWKHRTRQGRGGGREFPLSALPSQARAEILHRRIVEQASKAAGLQGKPRAPLPAATNLKAWQSEKLAARQALLELYADFKGDRSDRQSVPLFASAIAEGLVPIADWMHPLLPKKFCLRTLRYWIAASNSGDAERMASRPRGRRRSVFELSAEAADFIVGAHATQPLLGAEELHGLLKTNFPQGLPSANGIMLDTPSVATVARYLREWKSDAANRSALVAYTDPDRFKSHMRFAPGDASAGIARPNQVWQIDASPADVLCTDGRKTIYAVIDVATRRVMGLVTNTPRTAASLLLIARACQAWGVPETIGTDNGSDFVSRHFRITLRQLGVHHKVAPPFAPERKPFVERGIRSIQHKFMTLQRGFIGHDVADRQQIRARRSFAERLGMPDAFDVVGLSGDELHESFAAWLANIYAHRPHAGLGKRSPHEVALELLQTHSVQWAEPQAIGMLLMPPASGGGVRVVGKKGIQVDGIEYWADRLIPGQRLHVRLDPADMGKVWLYTDTDPMRFVGIGLNPDLAGLDRAELAARVRAEQAAIEREDRARMRRLTRQADIHSVADRMIGRAPLPMPANAAVNYSTAELEEAFQAAQRRDAVELLADRRVDQEETSEERYARAKQLRALVDAGTEISADSLQWLEGYESDREFKALKLVEEATG